MVLIQKDLDGNLVEAWHGKQHKVKDSSVKYANIKSWNESHKSYGFTNYGQVNEMQELKTGELLKATEKKNLVGFKLEATANPREVNTRFGRKLVYTVKDTDGKTIEFFGGAGLDKQNIVKGDRFILETVPTDKGNPMYVARGWTV